VIGLGHLAAAQRAEMPIPAAAPLQNIQLGFGRIPELGRLGCDVQDIGEFKQCIDNTDYKRSVFLAEFASPEEVAYCENRPDPVASLAGLMAAKEAILKAGHHGPLKSIPVEHENGAPVTRGFTLSVSHSANTAFAVALRFNDVSSLFRSAQAKSELDGVEQTTRVPSGWQRAAWAIYHVALLAAVAFLFVFSVARR